MVTSIIAIGIFQIPTLVRLTRGSANAIWAREFVLAARASGKGGFRITIEHVLPNVLPILIVQGTIQFALVVFLFGRMKLPTNVMPAGTSGEVTGAVRP